MLQNIDLAVNLRALSRIKAKDHETKSVRAILLKEFLDEGWILVKSTGNKVQLRRSKKHNVRLEDRVWTLLYRMGFQYLSGQNGAKLELNAKMPNSPVNQIDVVAIDSEVAIAIECKSAEKYGPRKQFQENLGKHNAIRQSFSDSVREQFPSANRRLPALAIFTHNAQLSEPDLKRAQEARVALFDEHDLAYYEELVTHLGPAAKYQFLADLLPGRDIPGLKVRIPAVRMRMGGHNCYAFSISPAYLLKLAYVSHRLKGKASDHDAYQRMIRKSRLQSIREYIDKDGIFPTNIVINLESVLRFDRGVQETETDNGLMGWLDLRPTYRSAWIIDGQHRLFAYSGHPRAIKAKLSVLAFEGLSASKQAELFIDINSEQKGVKQSLLQELYAELHWESSDPHARIRAIISKAVQALNADPSSPFYQRIMSSDDRKDLVRCISLTSMFRAMEHSGLFVATLKGRTIVKFGPLWVPQDNEATRKRTAYLLNHWFQVIRDSAPDWWNIGSGEGGGLAMNDGIAASINVLSSVLQYLDDKGQDPILMKTEQLFESVKPFAEGLGVYFGSLTLAERKQFRDLRGGQGQITRTRRCQKAIHDLIPDFLPSGLKEFMEIEEVQTNAKSDDLIGRIETMLRSLVVEELKTELGTEESEWWSNGIPKSVRAKVAQRHEEDDGQQGGREYYFDLQDYKKIILDNWETLNPILGYGKPNSGKERRTTWLLEVEEAKKTLAQAASGKSVPVELLSKLETYEAWLSDKRQVLAE